ncbi:hypothetical protein PV08_11792 [Exophiala spinifera]|uniref:Uncharacterized protein n=1 Tax=Exophiala spinifera TaxID=91928 RepID=A0A0D1Y538_9EURO|nr:uncharacterized protein PV08_11792 [Exophiala spinifera]KIW10016.1 hypothetical protein PV08_11792 [Exophiala spinifera]
MPALKHLVCNVQWEETGAPFPEYGTQYGDGFVETFIAIPNHPQPFSIRLSSRRFIHEGLAMLVYIDGKYQCNRIRVNLKSPRGALPETRSKIDFVVRQKETRLGDGAYMAREWRFDDYNIVQQLPPGASESHFESLGTIEVFVLRCNSNIPGEFDALSDSSKEDSVIMEHYERQTSGVQSTRTVAEPDFEGFPFAGLFDGPSNLPSSSRFLQVDGPADDHDYWDYRYRYGPAPYPPQERPAYHSHEHEHERVPDGTFYYRRPTPPTSPSPPNRGRDQPDHLPPRRERRVHFDYGTAREGPMYNDRHQSQRTPRYHHDYYPAQHYVGHHPEGDYPSRHLDIPYRNRDDGPRDYRDYPEPPMARGALRVPLASASRIPGLSEHRATLPNHTRMDSAAAAAAAAAPAPMPYTAVPPFAGQHQLPMQPWLGQPHPVFPPSMPGPTPIFPYLLHNNVPWFQAANQSGLQNTHSATNKDAAKQDASSTATSATAKAEPSAPASKDSDNNATNNTSDNSNTQNQGGSDNNTNKPEQNQSNSADKGTSNENYSQEWNEWQNGGSNDNTNNNTSDNNNWENQNTNDESRDQNNIDESWKGNNDTSDDNKSNLDESWKNNNDTADDNKSNKSNRDLSQEQNTSSNAQNVQVSTSNASGKMAWYGPHGLYQVAKFYRDASIPAIAEEEPRYDVPQAVAQAIGVTKQVQPGRGYVYSKKSVHPAEYLDTLQDPYARFIFKYRHREQIKTETGIDISSDPTPDADRNSLESKTKDELIELVLRAKGALGGTIPDPPKPKPVAPVVSAPLEHIPIAAPQHPFPSYYLPTFRRPSGTGSGSGVAQPPANTATTATAAAADDGWGSTNANSSVAEGKQKNNKNKNNNWQQGGEAQGWNDQQAPNTSSWDGQNEEEPLQRDQPNQTQPTETNKPASSGISPLALPGPSYRASIPVESRVWQDQDQDAPPPTTPRTSASSDMVRSVPLTDPFGPSEPPRRLTEEEEFEKGVGEPPPAGFTTWYRYFMHPNSPDIPSEYVREEIVDAPDRPPDPVRARAPSPPRLAPGEPHDFWR